MERTQDNSAAEQPIPALTHAGGDGQLQKLAGLGLLKDIQLREQMCQCQSDTLAIHFQPSKLHGYQAAGWRAGLNSPQVILVQERQISIVDIELKVICVAVESDYFALGIGRHALEQNPLVML